MILYDHRWNGTHGIGRFAREIAVSLDHRDLLLTGNPASPLDSLRLSLALRDADVRDVFFSPGYNAPLRCRQRFVLTVHDLNHIDRPENTSALKRLYYELVLRPACRRASCVLTVSEFARRRLIDWSGIAEADVVNVGNGISGDFAHPGPSAGRQRPYFLCVSNRRAHKNESRVIAALRTAKLPAEVQLVLTGRPTPSLAAEIERLQLAGRVCFAGAITDRELAALYRDSIALVFPSLYEGFGLPVVEAMACGAPVITSTTTALPEVAGDAALLVDPMDVEALSGAMTRVYGDADLRSRLAAAGLRRVPLFDWRAVRKRVAAALSGIDCEVT